MGGHTAVNLRAVRKTLQIVLESGSTLTFDGVRQFGDRTYDGGEPYTGTPANHAIVVDGTALTFVDWREVAAWTQSLERPPNHTLAPGRVLGFVTPEGRLESGPRRASEHMNPR